MDTERRRARIVELVRSHDFVRVADLGEMLGVSPVTVRGDLDVLAARGDVRRIRGGGADGGEMPGASPVPARGDLDVLAARGDVRRIRGGAISHDAPAEAPAD